MSLVTRCPKCQSAFLVVLDQLRLHEGLVRCGNCAYVFDGFATLETELPTLNRPAPLSEEPQASATMAPIQPELNSPSVIRYRSDPAVNPSSNPASEPDDDAEHGWARETKQFDEPVLRPTEDDGGFSKPPTFTKRKKTEFAFDDENSPPAVVARILWALSIFAATVLLLGQLVFVFRNDIAQALPQLRPALTELCSKFKCEVGYSQRLERITIDSTSLQLANGSSADGQTSSFNFLFTMRNRYDQKQPWPNLILSLKDASGTVVVRKVVAHYQYLPPSLLDQPFDKGQEVNLTLPLTVNGLQISGFLLDKYFP